MTSAHRLAPAAIALALSSLCIPGVASAEIRPGNYCVMEHLGPPAGPDAETLYADARIQRKPGRWWVRFTTGRLERGPIVGTKTVLARQRSADLLTFAFKDNWGWNGVGTFRTRGRGIAVHIERTTPATSDGKPPYDNADNRYGDFVLQRAPCKEPRDAG